MSFNEMYNVWTILRENRFDFDVNLYGDCLCIICKSILINAHAAPCGCRFCLVCITTHLDRGNVFCPGITDDCKHEPIDINVNIHIDPAFNMKILRMRVKCSERNCEFIGDLRNMVGHLRMCNERRASCLYLDVDDKGHQSVKESIDNLRNEYELLKRDFENNKNEKELIKLQLLELQNQSVEKDEEIKKLKNKYKKTKLQMKQIQEMSGITVKQEEVSSVRLQLETKLNESLQIIKILAKEIGNIKDNLKQKTYGEFIWTITKWKEQMMHPQDATNKWFYSDSFYSHKNGYKMCLAMKISGVNVSSDSHLSFGFCLMKGSFDDILPWPFKHNVSFDLINRQTGTVYKKTTIIYSPVDSDYNRPLTERNNEIYYYSFIAIKNLPDDDTLFIKCNVQLL